jgi:hypothetical protein
MMVKSKVFVKANSLQFVNPTIRFCIVVVHLLKFNDEVRIVLVWFVIIIK